MAAEQAAAGASTPAVVNPADAAAFKGVSFTTSARPPAVFEATFTDGGVQQKLGHFCAAEEAARAYDDAERKAGRRVVNFPRPGTDEVQAVRGEREVVTLLRAAGKLFPQRSGPLPPAPDYKGVHVDATARTAAVFAATLMDGGVQLQLGRFCTAEEAARAYDDAARKAARRVVNFPRPDTDEVQAVKGEEDRLTLLRAAGTRAPLRSGPLPPDPGYKGVRVDAAARTAAVFVARIDTGGVRGTVGQFCTAEEAARAYDDAARKAGRRAVNFPRPGTDEVQAVKGEEDRVTLLRADGKRGPPRSGPLPPDPGYKGVRVDADARTAAVFDVRLKEGRVQKTLGRFHTAEEAACAYDDAVRLAGRRVVNFPRSNSHEVQAVKGESEEVTLLRHGGKLLPPRSGPLPSDPDFKGVNVDSGARTAAVFAAYVAEDGAKKSLGRFCIAEEAARAYDDAIRRAGRRVVNFPRPGTDEVQAVKGEMASVTLARHSAVHQAAGAADAGGAITAPVPRKPRSKRRAAAPAPSEPPRKRATAPSIKTETPAAVKPEAPVAPPHVPYTASTGRPLQAAFAAAQAALAASLSPDDGPGLDAPATGIKTETPAPVKTETSAAPPAVAASGVASPAPPSASAAAAPPVKMEHDSDD